MFVNIANIWIDPSFISGVWDIDEGNRKGQTVIYFTKDSGIGNPWYLTAGTLKASEIVTIINSAKLDASKDIQAIIENNRQMQEQQALLVSTLYEQIQQLKDIKTLLSAEILARDELDKSLKALRPL